MNDEIVQLHHVNWTEDPSILGFFEHALRVKEEHNLDAERQAEFNTAWYLGRQLQFWSRERRRMETQENPHGRVRLTINLMRGLINGYVAKLGQAGIYLEGEPATDDLLDFERARLQTRVFDYYHRLLNLRRTVLRSDLAAVLHGEAFLKVTWDPSAGEDYGIVRAEEVGMEEPEFRKKYGDSGVSIRGGDLRVADIPVFNIAWGPPGVPFEEAEWVLEIYERSVGYVAQRYGLKPADVPTDSDADVRIVRPNEVSLLGSAGRERREGVTLVKELWVASNSALPGLKRGRHVVAVGGKVVRNTANPYRHGRIPIVRWMLEEAPGAPRGETPVTDLLAPQADLNRSVSQFAENREVMANPVWIAPELSIVDAAEWNTAAGGVRRYRGPQPPRIEPGQSMPNAVMLMIQYTLRWMQDIIGLRDVSQGKNPAGVRAARSIALLREADDERMASVAQRRADAWREVGWLMLLTLEQYITEERLLRISGEEQTPEILRLTGSQLGVPGRYGKLGISPYDVKVSTRGRPRSRSSMLEDLDRLMERGFLTPQNPEHVAYVMAFLDDDMRVQRDPKKDARQVQHLRNWRMAQGEYTPPDTLEDLETMLGVLREFCGKTFFRLLAPEIQALFHRYEDEATMLMAQRSARRHVLIQQGIQGAGVRPAGPEAQPAPAPAAPPVPVPTGAIA